MCKALGFGVNKIKSPPPGKVFVGKQTPSKKNLPFLYLKEKNMGFRVRQTEIYIFISYETLCSVAQ